MMYRQVPTVQKQKPNPLLSSSILSIGTSFTASAGAPIKEDRVFAYLGNLAHALLLTNTLLFALASFTSDLSISSWLDEQWKQDGFCVKNSHVAYGNSHDVCFYFDMLASIVLITLYWSIHKTPGMDKANEYFAPGILLTLAHGVVHWFLGKAIRDGALATGVEQPNNPTTKGYEVLGSLSWDDIVTLQLPSLLFWFTLIKACCSDEMSRVKVGVLAALALLVQLVVPVQLGFVFVQTVVVVAFSLNQLVRPSCEKDFMYATFPVNVGFPVALVAWLEAAQCTPFVKDKLYGHLVFEAVLQFALVAWYILCFLFIIGAPSMAKRVKKVKFA